ncbi:hypothetical protein AUQ37_04200 [Candidatus Methanomethylophilus sp. 1R26]|jgi:hypothetical protein|nr:hypothetical protein AUQ37_04200 [Candidatus Methanomethylophilus sp. 1R26]
MNWMKMSKIEAKSLTDSLNKMDTDTFDRQLEEWSLDKVSGISDDYSKLRAYLYGAARKYTGTDDVCYQHWDYSMDLKLAVDLYRYTVQSMGMTPAIASEDDIWIYIHMKVVPGIMYARWAGSERVNAKRCWSIGARLWFKSLWWYIYLSMQNDSLDETYEILKNNGSDDIYQLLDRKGNGYRVELCRSIMRRYGNTPNHGKILLKRVLKLNVLNCATIVPELYDGGLDAYVEMLFNRCGA